MKYVKHLFLLIALVSLCSCAAQKKREITPSGIFFPPPPQLPRIQYLTSFTGLKDIEEQSSFNKFVVGEKQDLRLDKPYGVAIYDGKIYVCDTNSTVFVFDLNAKTYSALKGANGSGKLVQPLNISIESDGTKYVADPVRGQVVVFDREDNFLKAYGQAGKWRPVDAVPLGEFVYVADPANKVVSVLKKDSGEVVRNIGDKGEASEKLSIPTNLAFDDEGYLYVTDVGRFQVVKYDRDGHYQKSIGRPGDNLGHFSRPKGIAVDRSGNLFVADASFNNVQIFGKSGRLLMFFGEGGEAPAKFLLPAKVAIDYNNNKYFQKYVSSDFELDYIVLVSSQLGGRSISVLGFGKKKGARYPTEEELLKAIEERRKQELEKRPQ